MIALKNGGTLNADIVYENPVEVAGVKAYYVRFWPPIRMGAHISTSPVDAYIRADAVKHNPHLKTGE